MGARLWGWGSLCLNLGFLEPTKKQSPGPLAERLLRDEPVIDHMLLLPLTTHSTTWAWVPPDALPPSEPMLGFDLSQLRLMKSTREPLGLTSFIFLASSSMAGDLCRQQRR